MLDTNFGFAIGRGRLTCGLSGTPARTALNAGSPVFCSTRLPGQVAVNLAQEDTLPIATDSTLNDLITHIAQQVGQTIREQLRGECEGRDVSGTQAQSSVSQVPRNPTDLNLTGVKLVLQSDVKEPPVFQGDGSDKNTVCEWEELMEVYLRKRAIPVNEQHSEIMSKLMGKAKDIVRITLRSSPSLKPQENPKIIYDILRQHFSEVTYSCMPMADFYRTVPMTGETPVEYWLRLNKAVDIAEEGLKRLGRQLENPCQEAAIMFVKYCPDPTIAALLKFKAPDKWTASEIQEHINRFQTEMKELALSKSRCSRTVTAHAQTPELNDSATVCHPAASAIESELSVASKPSCDDDSLKRLVSLFDRALAQNNRTVPNPVSFNRFQPWPCSVCKSSEHSTLAHCRQKRLCLACFEPNHLKRNCPKRQDVRAPPLN